MNVEKRSASEPERSTVNRKKLRKLLPNSGKVCEDVSSKSLDDPMYRRLERMLHSTTERIERFVHQKNALQQEWEQKRQITSTTNAADMRIETIEKAVYEWMRRMMYYKDIRITEGLLQKMALQFKSALGVWGFFPNTDWCNKFRQTYQIYDMDSRMLTIAYAQACSVQIPDIIRDVVNNKTNPNGTTVRQSTVNKLNTAAMPVRHVYALPIGPPSSSNMPQKVLVATPINTIAKLPASANVSNLPSAMPQLLHKSQTTVVQAEAIDFAEMKLEIKQEIKEEISSDADEETQLDSATAADTFTQHQHANPCIDQLPAIRSNAEARNYLKLLEDYALRRENFPLISLITRADELLRSEEHKNM